MSTLRVSNIEAKADPSSPSVDEKLKVTNSNGDVLIHIDGKTAGITTVGINTTDKSFTVDAAQNVEFLGIVTATKFSLSGGGEITGGDGNFTGIVTAGSLSVTNNVSIGGTLTYEDVTSIDSVGIITAQSDVHVGAGLSVVGISTLANTNVNGQLTASNFNVTGVSTLGNIVIGTGTTELIVTGDARVTGILTATTFSGNLTGNVTGNVTGESTLSGISSSISDTATDVFVYDTSKDSDGGAWRKRTTHTSWYNETLGTATRGTRKEFPAVAVIVVEDNGLTIYDGDDPDLPMWMKWTSTTMLRGGTSRKLAVKNGIIALSAAGTYNGLIVIYFISDTARSYRAIGSNNNTEGYWRGDIAGRNDYSSNNYSNGSGGNVLPAIVSENTNDVAMTVLPNAPIDSATGLPVPTIAVATVGGVSVIKDNGNVVDYTYQVAVNKGSDDVYLSETGRLQYSTRSSSNGQIYYVEYDQLSSSDVTSAPNVVLCVSQTGGSGITRILPKGHILSSVITDEFTATGLHPNTYTNYQGGLFLHKTTGDVKETDGVSLPNNNFMGVHIRPDYNTGWQHGDIKGAFLSDTDTTNVTGSNLIDNGDFGTGNFTNWSTSGTTAPSISSGGALLTTGTADGAIWQSTSGEATSGKWVITWTITSNSGGFFGLFLNNDGANGSGGSLVYDGWTTSGSYYYEGSIAAVEFRHRGSSSGIIDNITLRRVEDDRSVNNKGLSVLGTVTKSAVATGAELVAYSGFSGSNLLAQPYNSDLNPGTGDYSFTFWFKCSSTGGEQIYMRRFGVPTVTGGMMMRLVSSSSVLQWYVRDTSSTATAVNSSMVLDDGSWHCAVGTREGATAKLYIDGRLDSTSGCSANSHDPGTTASLVIGAEEVSASPGTYQNPADLSSMALMRYSLSAPSATQIKKIYEDEKVLFQENVKATLYGSSDAVTALAYDEVTDQLHVGTSAGRSDFQGLRRINNTTTAVTTAISAHDEFIIEQ